MKTLLFLVVLLLPVLLPADLVHTPENLIQVENLRFGLLHWDSKWHCASQADSPGLVAFAGEGATSTPEGERRDGTFQVVNGEFQLSETIRRISGNEWIIQYRLTSETGVATRSLAFGAKFPTGDFPSTFCRIGGSPLKWSSSGNQQTWRLTPKRPFQITLDNGILELSADAPLLIRYPKGKERPSFRLEFPDSSDSALRKAELSFRLRYQPFATHLIDLKPQMTMGFSDPVPNDGRGGWTDQGPDNDLSSMKPGIHEFAGIRFSIVDPAENRGKSTLAFRGKMRPGFQERSEIPLPAGIQGKYLYLLNGVAWPPAKGSVCGIVQMEYEDGTFTETELKCGTDTGNFWDAKDLKNGYVGWRNVNLSTNIGLYVTKIPLKGERSLRKLILRSAGEVWMVPAATITSAEMRKKETYAPITIRGNARWMPLADSRNIKRHSVLDCSFLLEKPAGKYGFLKVSGENFEFEKRPGHRVRFWGANLCSTAITLSNAHLDSLLDMLAAQGCNLLRLHHFDWLLFRPDSSRNTATLERMDYLLAGARQRGIYLSIDLYTARTFPDVKKPKWSFYFQPEFRKRLLDDIIRDLLNHRNVYTGMKWKHDPALAFLNFINEGSLSIQYQRASKELREQADREFRIFAGQRKWKISKRNRNERMEQWLRHIAEKAYTQTAQRLREEGVRIPFCDQNFRDTASLALSRRLYDYVDSHYYWGHPTFLGKRPWQPPYMVYPGSSIPAGGAINSMFRVRLLGKPFALTEWNHCFPNPRGGEGPFLVGAYSALQNFSALAQFTAADRANGLDGSGAIGPFDGAVNPILRLGMRAGAFLFLRGDVAESEIEIPLYQPEEYWKYPGFQNSAAPNTVGLIAKTGLVFQPEPAGCRAVLYPASVPLSGKSAAFHGDDVLSTIEQMISKGILPKGSLDRERQIFTSSTGELVLDKKQQTFQSVTPRSESFLLPEGKNGNGKFAVLRNRKSDASFLIASLDGSLEQSRRILILHLTDVKNEGSVFRDPRLVILEKNGSTQPLILRGEALLSLNHPFHGTLYACDITGRRIREVPRILQNGKESYLLKTDFDGKTPVLVYELVR